MLWCAFPPSLLPFISHSLTHSLVHDPRLSRRPEWQRSREFEATTSSSSQGQYGYRASESMFAEEELGNGGGGEQDEDAPGKSRVRVVFQPTMDTTHTIYYRGHWLRVQRGRKGRYSGYDTLSIRSVFSFLSLSRWEGRGGRGWDVPRVALS